MPIIQKMVFTLLLVSLLPVFSAGSIFYFSSKASLKHQVQSQLEAIATIQRDRTENLIAQNDQLLGSFTSRQSLVKLIDRYDYFHSKADLALIQQALAETKSGVKSFKAITVLSPAGDVLASTRTADIGKNYVNEQYFEQGQMRGDVTSSFFRDENGNPTVYLAGPLSLDSQPIGVVVIESDAQNLMASTKDYTGLGQTGETILVKRDGQGNGLNLAPLRNDREAALHLPVNINDSNDPVTRALAKQEGFFTDSVDYRGHKVLAATRYIKSADWGLVVKIDQAEAYQPLAQLRDLSIVMLFILSVMIILVAFYLARRLNEPILALAAVADKIRAGDLSQRAHINTNDEIGELAGTFNAMASSFQKVDQMKSEFVLLTSHQLRTPATAVKGFISMLLDGYRGKLKPRQRESLEAAYKENEVQISVINSILDVARLDAGELTLERSMADIGELIDTCAQGQAPILHAKDQTLKVVQPKEPVMLWVDPMKLKMVIDNLVNNASKYSPPGTTITVELEPGAEQAEIRVQDQGIGISRRDLPHLFKRFSRIAVLKTANIQGAGLGLYLADKLVRMHGGTISVKSELNVGTAFTVELPNVTKPA